MNINAAIHNNYPPAIGYSPWNSTDKAIDPVAGIKNSSHHDSEVSNAVSDAGSNTKANRSSSPESSNTRKKQQSNVYDSQLTRAELQLVTELKKVDSEVRRHEMAHVAAGGSLITSGANFTYKRGPDGQNYAVTGEVSIDTSAIPGDPQATLQKMKKVKNAALAPAHPSAQDLKVASQATSMASKALSELMMLRAEEQAASRETKAFGGMKQASDSYIKVSNLPEEETSTFKLAV